MLDLGANWAQELKVGDLWRLSGGLGAGKTTLVRGMLAGLGYVGDVRSPSFTLIQEYSTSPPVLHVDLYRLKDAQGLGLEDALQEAAILLEWPDRLTENLGAQRVIEIHIEFAEEGRLVTLTAPQS